MYVCICRGITEDQIKEVVQKGHQGKDALKRLGVGDDCGICLLEAIEIYSNQANQQSNSNDSKNLQNQKPV